MKNILLIALCVCACQVLVAQDVVDIDNKTKIDQNTSSKLSSKVVFEGNISSSEGEVLYNFKLSFFDGSKGEIYVKEWGTGKMIISEKKRKIRSGMSIIYFDVKQPSDDTSNETFPWNELVICDISNKNAKERLAIDAALITDKDYIIELRGTTPLNMSGNLIEGTIE